MQQMTGTKFKFCSSDEFEVEFFNSSLAQLNLAAAGNSDRSIQLNIILYPQAKSGVSVFTNENLA